MDAGYPIANVMVEPRKVTGKTKYLLTCVILFIKVNEKISSPSENIFKLVSSLTPSTRISYVMVRYSKITDIAKLLFAIASKKEIKRI